MREIKFRVWIYTDNIKEGRMTDEYYQFDQIPNTNEYRVFEDWRDADNNPTKEIQHTYMSINEVI